ncbi:MAG: hypothetical protein U0228_34310 [Myxococcaceae bacterium]
MTTERELRDLLESTQRRLREAERTLAEQETAIAFAAQRERELIAEAEGLRQRVAALSGRETDELAAEVQRMRGRLVALEQQLANRDVPSRRGAAVSVCPRCGSSDLIFAATLNDARAGEVEIGVDGDPSAAMFRDREKTTLFGTVCGECGLVEFSADAPSLLRDAAARRQARLAK